MQPTQTLPESYQLSATFDLKTNKKLMIWLNIVGLVLTAAFLALFWWLAALLRPEIVGVLSVRFDTLWDIILLFVVFLITMAAVLILHEGVHGFFFWLFSKTRPLFAFKGAYAYAAAPDWYFPRNHYLVIGLAPLVFLSELGILLMPVFPLRWMWALLVFLVFNASGAVGDLAVCGWLLFKPKTVLLRDFGDAIEVYSAYLTENDQVR